MEFRVPFLLRVSSTPLFVKVVVLKNFPVQAPIIEVMDRVVHKDIDTKNYNYIGAGVKQWTPQSNLVNLLQRIYHEFQTEPPIHEALLQI